MQYDNPDPRAAAGNAVGPAKLQVTRIQTIEESAEDIRTMAQQIEQRIHLALERAQGSRPVDPHVQEVAVDQPGTFGSIAGKHSDTQQILDRTIGLLNDLEQLI